jgi:hypothetical protein
MRSELKDEFGEQRQFANETIATPKPEAHFWLRLWHDW